MYEMAHKAREAMKGKAKRLAGEKDQKTDSSNWTPAEPLNADAKTGMRPVSKQGYKKGGKVEGAKAMTHAGRKPRKSGGRALTADSLVNRNVKEANEEREGEKHVGGMKKGGRAKKALGGMPTDALKGSMNPSALLNYLQSATGLKLKKGGRAERKAGGNVNVGPQEMPAGKKAPSTKEQIAEEKREQDMSKPTRGKVGHYADGGAPVPVVLANTGPGYTPGMNMSKDVMNFGVGAKGSPYKKGGMAKFEGSAKDEAQDKKLAKKHGMSMKAWEASKMDAKHDKQQSMKGLKSGGEAGGKKWISEAISKPGALHKSLGVPAGEKIPAKKLEKATHSDNPKLAKRANLAKTLRGMNRPNKFGGGALGALNMGPGKAAGGSSKGKGKTTIAININAGQPQPDQMAAGMPGMPPGLPPRPTGGGIPVPMGMPAVGGTPPAAAPMPMPMPMPPAGGGMPPMARKAGGKVYRSYKDMDAGAGSGLGRLEKTEIQKRKG
jgi:hypothetical protein